MARVLKRILLLGLALFMLWLGSVPIRIWWEARQDDRRPSDVVVVLGAAQYNGQPSQIFAERLQHAADLYEQGLAGTIVTVGAGATGDITTEAAAGLNYLIDLGIPAADVTAIPEGSNTQESLEAVAAVADDNGWSTVILVSDPWHSFRSEALASAAGLDAVASPVRSGPAVQERSTQVRYILRESGAYVVWRLTGATALTGPEAA